MAEKGALWENTLHSVFLS